MVQKIFALVISKKAGRKLQPAFTLIINIAY